MEPKMIKDAGGWQRNLNTIFLSLCLAGIYWVLTEIKNLEVSVATQSISVSTNSASILELRKASNDQSTIIQKMDIRLSRVETIQDQNQKRQ